MVAVIYALVGPAQRHVGGEQTRYLGHVQILRYLGSVLLLGNGDERRTHVELQQRRQRTHVQSLQCSRVGSLGGLLGIYYLVGLIERIGHAVESVVYGPKFECCRGRQQIAHAVRLLDARQLDRDTVGARHTLDVGLRNAQNVDTALQHLERRFDGIRNLLLQISFQLRAIVVVVARIARTLEDVAYVVAVSSHEGIDERVAVILGRRRIDCAAEALVIGVVRIECDIALAAGMCCDHVGGLDFQHDVHTAFEVETEIQLTLLALLICILCDTEIVDRLVPLLGEVGLGVLFTSGLTLDTVRDERKRELKYAGECQKYCQQFDSAFALHCVKNFVIIRFV